MPYGPGFGEGGESGMGAVADRPGAADAAIGVLMLETRFPRLQGDIGHPGSFDFPVLYATVPGADPGTAVRGDPAGLLPDFVAAGRALVGQGAVGLTTSCGFLAPFQTALAEGCGVPVAASSLMQVPLVQRLLPAGRRVGVLTADAGALGPAHLAAAGAPADIPVSGPGRDSHFSAVYVGNRPTLDPDRARADLCAAADRLCADFSDVGAIVLECTNMAPWAADIARRTGRPVYDMRHLLGWFRAGLAAGADAES